MANVISNGRLIDFEAAVALMDSGVIEDLAGVCHSEQEFIDVYSAAHAAKFGSEFDTSGLNPIG